MKIQQLDLTLRDLVGGCHDDDAGGVARQARTLV